MYLCGEDARDVGGGEGRVGGFDGAGQTGGACQVDGATGVFNDDGVKAEALAVDGGEANAEVVSEAAEEEAGEIAFAEIPGEAGGGGVVVLKEGGVGVDVGAETLAEDAFGLGNVEGRVKLGAGGLLQAVIGPEALGSVGGLDRLVGLLVGVGAGEGDVGGGMPVLGEDNMGKAGGECVDEGDNGVGVRYGQEAARAEVVLEVDDEQRVGGAECHCRERAPDSEECRRTIGRSESHFRIGSRYLGGLRCVLHRRPQFMNASMDPCRWTASALIGRQA